MTTGMKISELEQVNGGLIHVFVAGAGAAAAAYVVYTVLSEVSEATEEAVNENAGYRPGPNGKGCTDKDKSF